MFIIGVLPISRGAPHRELSYFSPERIPEGSIVRIKLRTKIAYGLVMRAEDASAGKQDIKKSSFSLNKLASKEHGAPLSKPFLRTVFELAAHHACGAGAVLDRLVPAAVLKRAAKLPLAQDLDTQAHHEVLYLAAPLAERIAEYRALARESLARGKSLLIIAPTVFEAERLARDVGRGIEDRVALLHGSLSEKALISAWESALAASQAVLIVGTSQALSLPRNDLGSIIVERETSRSYEDDLRPYLSLKAAAELLARNLGIRFILAATTPSTDTFCRDLKHEAHEYGLPRRRLSGLPPEVLDARREKGKKFSPLLPQSYALLDESLRTKTPLLIIAARRGMAPVTVCDDCASVLTCERCASPLVLHRTDTSKFLCHYCGIEESASIRCRTCGGWRLTALGIGVDRIAEVLGQERPDVRFAVASHDRLKAKDAPKLAAQFLSGDPAVLISTEFIVPYLPDSSTNIVVASIDSFMSIPEYRMSERIFSLLSELRTKAKDHYIIQTRSPEHSAISACLEGSSVKLMREECAEREQFGYPPAVTLIRIALSGKNAEHDAKQIEAALAQKHSPMLREGRLRGEKRYYVILKFSAAWPDPALVKFLRSLPPNVEVRINPPTLSLD